MSQAHSRICFGNLARIFMPAAKLLKLKAFKQVNQRKGRHFVVVERLWNKELFTFL